MPDEAEFSAKFIVVFLKRFYKDIHTFKVLSVVTPKLRVKRITKTENVKQLPKSIDLILLSGFDKRIF